MAADTLGILLISGGHDRAHYAFLVAAGAAAIGRDVVVFATNYGCAAMVADLSRYTAEENQVISTGVASLEELRSAAGELGVRKIACEAGLRMAGIDETLDNAVEIAGITTFLEATRHGQLITL